MNNHSENFEEHVHRDDFGAKMGMWLFLFTELLLFGGLFLLYMAYRLQYSHEFHIAARELNIGIGTFNTIILLTSSMTMALSITAMRLERKTLSLFLLASTILLAFGFLVNKFFEWSAKFGHGLYPGSDVLLDKPRGEYLFYGMYYAMTGLHAIHVIVGMIILTFMFVFISRNSITSTNYIKLENSGLYWHLVDLIWIFLFPLFYLMR
ncbi:MAG: cytochrome c oxidase subunit 3 [Ignavibacteriae bacterium]|nr:cytochrome c oxidase subunit 3 [Ignavibacteriota bacterium]